MKYLLLLLFTFNIIAGSFAQEASGIIDSLQNELVKVRQIEPIDKNSEGYLLLKLSYYSFNDPAKALDYATQALEVNRAVGNKQREAKALVYIGAAEKDYGNNLKAIEYYIKAANIQHEEKLFHNEANTLSSIAALFGGIGDVNNATQYFHNAIELLTTYHDTLLLASTQSNMGEFYRKYAELDSAIFYFNQSLQNYRSIKDDINTSTININISTCLGNLGMSYLAKGNVELAKPLLEQTNQYFTINFDPYRKSVYQCELGKLHILEGNIKQGEELISNSIQMAKIAHLKEQIRDFSLILSEFYQKQKQPQKALEYFQQYKTYDDSIKDVENVRMLEQQQSQFQLSRKDEEIATLNKINRLQRFIAFGLIIGTIIFIVFIFILFDSNKKIKSYNREIIAQKQIVEQRENEKALLLRELNHRVKNNLQMVASLLSLHSRQLKGHPAAEALMAGKYRVEALTLIHQKLYRDDIDTKIDIKHYIEELTQNLVMNFGQEFELQLYLIPFVMKIDKAIPLGLILNELVTNSLKYAKENNDSPKLRITITENTEFVILLIEDNGIGLPENFDFKQSKSFGLKLVHSLINQLAGKIEWTSDKGTSWKITLNKLKIT